MEFINFTVFRKKKQITNLQRHFTTKKTRILEFSYHSKIHNEAKPKVLLIDIK